MQAINDASDTDLLRDYAQNASEAAFCEIVRRYADFVYSAVLRQVENQEAARDVVQMVFSDLARKARSLHENTLLIGWLYHGARLAALEQLRRDRRRLYRERQAMDWQESASDGASDWDSIRPILDEAIATLGDEDRDALLMRFFKNESLLSVGTALGVSEDAAQKRVSRALDKLRHFLTRRGIHTTVATLSVALTANAVQAAPLDLCASLMTTVLAKAGVENSVTVFSKLITFTEMKFAIVSFVLAAAIAGLAYQLLSTRHQLRSTEASLEQQLAEVQALRAANLQLANQTNELNRLREEAKDVLRLRGEVARLRQEQAALKRSAVQATQAETNNPVKEPSIDISAKFISVPTEKLGDIGLANLSNRGSELMDDHEVRNIFEALKKIGGAELLSESRITTANGHEASLSSTQQAPFGGTNIDVGENVRVNPHYSTNSSLITLDFAAESRQLIDISLNQDESQRDLKTTAFTNSLSVANGQSILLRTDSKDPGHIIGSTNTFAEPKSLLLVITPNLVNGDGSVHRLERMVKRTENSVPAPR